MGTTPVEDGFLTYFKLPLAEVGCITYLLYIDKFRRVVK